MNISSGSGDATKKFRSGQLTSRTNTIGNNGMSAEVSSNFAFELLPEEIRENIFKLLSVGDLLNCRLVNNEWKKDASAVLRLHTKCYAVVKKPCKDLLRLDQALNRSSFDMINGLKIMLCTESPERRGRRGPPRRSLIAYLTDRLLSFPFKFLDIDGHSDYRIPCPAAKTVKKILWNARRHIEELYLGSEASCGLLEDFSEFNSGEVVTFPKLLRVSFDSSISADIDSIMSEDVVKFFVEATPNLKEINYGLAWRFNDRGPNFEDFCKKSTYVMIHDYEDPSSVTVGLNNCLQGRLCLKVVELASFCNEIWKRPLIQLLMAQRDTLSSVSLCPDVIIELMEAAGPTISLSKVTSLELLLPTFFSPESFTAVLERINFGKTFPALQEFSLMADWWEADEHPHEDYLSNLQNVGEHEEVTCCAKSITATPSACRVPVIQCLGLYFPWTSQLDLKCDLSEWVVCEIFAAFPKLEKLSLDITLFNDDMYFGDASVDAVLCGISMEEACLLQEQSRSNEIQLTNLEVVPMRPRLTDLKCLKELRLEIQYDEDALVHQISEVSGILAFSKLPDLKVFVKGSLGLWEGLKRLMPYVAEVETDCVKQACGVCQ